VVSGVTVHGGVIVTAACGLRLGFLATHPGICLSLGDARLRRAVSRSRSIRAWVSRSWRPSSRHA